MDMSVKVEPPYTMEEQNSYMNDRDDAKIKSLQDELNRILEFKSILKERTEAKPLPTPFDPIKEGYEHVCTTLGKDRVSLYHNLSESVNSTSSLRTSLQYFELHDTWYFTLFIPKIGRINGAPKSGKMLYDGKIDDNDHFQLIKKETLLKYV